MTLSQLQELISEYDEAKWAPHLMNVSIGCDCGCGGDSYTTESWNAEVNASNAAIRRMKEFCTKYGIDYDGI